MNPSRHYVGLFDILGSKEQIRRDLIGYAARFREFLILVKQGVDSVLPQISSHSALEVRAFQDTIIMTWPHRDVAPNDEFTDIVNIAFLVAFMIANGLERGLPLRGAISDGEVLRTPEGVFGICIEEAQLLHDASNWIGAAFADSTAKLLLESVAYKKIKGFPKEMQSHMRGALGPIVEYGVPLKANAKVSPKDRIVVDWPIYTGQQILINEQAGDPRELVRNRYQRALGLLPPPDETAGVKQKNTLAFVEFSLRGEAILKEQQKAFEMVRETRKGTNSK